MPEAGASRVAIVAGFAAIYFVWGGTFLAIRWAVETIPPFAMMSLRCLAGGTIMLLLARFRERDFTWPARREWGGAAVVGGLFFLGCHGVLAYVETRVPSGIAALCLATIPLFVPLLMWLIADGHRPSARTTVALLVAFGGVALLVAVQGAGGGLSVGDAALLLLSALAWASGTVATRMVPMPHSPLAAAGASLLTGGAVLAGVALAIGEWSDVGNVSTRSAGGLVYLVLIGTVATFGAYIWLLRVVPPAHVATYGFVNPVVAVFLGWLLADEALSAGTLVASAVIVVAVAVVILDREPSARPREADPSTAAAPVPDD